MNMNDSSDAPFFGLPNGSVTPNCHNNISHRAAPYQHGPCNEKAKKVNHHEVMSETLHAKR